MANEVVLNADGTENARPIARVQVKDSETGIETPVDVKTCARAVTCNQGVDFQTHLEALYGHAEDTTVHLTSEEKNGLETATGAQEKADSALAASKEYTDTKSVDLAVSMNTATDAKIAAALETAASDASTKANTAKTEAVTEATTIATEKAAAAEAAALAAAKEYADVVGATKAASVHAHAISDVTDLQTALNGKAASSHGNHVPATQTASNKVFLRNDNTWQTVTPANIGAAASSHNQAASTITAGTFAGQVVANSSGQTYSTSLLRNSKLVSAETNPTVNGEINWTYG